MNEDMPWVNLTQEEVDELRTKKHELTEYGKQRLKELTQQGISKYSEALKLMKDQEPYPDAMFEEAERREAERKALDALDKLYDENGDAMKQLAEIEKEEWERKERSETVLRRYNHFYNEECSGMPHGTPITPEHMQAMALECMVDALICENMNVEYNVIAIDDIKDLIAGLYKQSDEFLERVRKNNE
jgi:hypothetical protein